MDIVQLTEILGNVGEFIGAIAVVATLFYLALQVRHSKEATEANTRSLDESRRVALVQAYQQRQSEAAISHRWFADSDIPKLAIKYRTSGLDSLSEEERLRFGSSAISNLARMDATHYAYEQGLLPDWDENFRGVIKLYGPMWRDLGFLEEFPGRQEFLSEIRRVLNEAAD